LVKLLFITWQLSEGCFSLEKYNEIFRSREKKQSLPTALAINSSLYYLDGGFSNLKQLKRNQEKSY